MRGTQECCDLIFPEAPQGSPLLEAPRQVEAADRHRDPRILLVVEGATEAPTPRAVQTPFSGAEPNASDAPRDDSHQSEGAHGHDHLWGSAGPRMSPRETHTSCVPELGECMEPAS